MSLKAFDLLAESQKPKFVGGAERQQVLIARGLQEEGFDVRFVTLDVGQLDALDCKGIQVFKAYKTGDGLPLLRAFRPRWTGLNSALMRADADIYHQMCADSETGQVAMWCRSHDRRFLFAVASDADCKQDLPLLKTVRQRWLYKSGLRKADAVVVQTQSQLKTLREQFGIEATIINSCSVDPGFSAPSIARVPKGERPVLAAVSRIVAYKRIDWILDLAESNPQLDVLIVGNGDMNDSYIKGLFERGGRLSNVQMLGGVSDRALWEVYGKADLFVDASTVAGVPTTFLESWARGVPVVSTVDPDGIVARNNLGRVVSTTAEMTTAVKQLLGDTGAWTACSTAGRKYFEENYTVKAVVKAYRSIFSQIGVR